MKCDRRDSLKEYTVGQLFIKIRLHRKADMIYLIVAVAVHFLAYLWLLIQPDTQSVRWIGLLLELPSYVSHEKTWCQEWMRMTYGNRPAKSYNARAVA